MSDLSSHLKAAFRISLFFLSACFVIWALLPLARPYAAGLILGTLGSLFNTQHLARKVKQISRMAMEKKPQLANTGLLSRAAIAFMVAVIAIKFPQHIHLISALVGLFFVQMVTIVLEMAQRRNKGES